MNSCKFALKSVTLFEGIVIKIYTYHQFMTRNEGISRLMAQVHQMKDSCNQMEEAIFFTRRNDKWSPAEQLQHLMLSIRPLQMAFSLPGIILRIAFGKPTRIASSYNQLKGRYTVTIESGAKAAKPYIPKQLKTEKSQLETIADYLFFTSPRA